MYTHITIEQKSVTILHKPIPKLILHKPILNKPILHKPIPQPILHKPISKSMAIESLSDEALIQKLSGVHISSASEDSSIKIHQAHVIERDWNLAIIAKVIAQKPLNDTSLINSLIRLWKINPDTKFSPQGSGKFLVTFKSENEMNRILFKGPWIVRNELIVVQKIKGEEDLIGEVVNHVELWMQLHHLPLEQISNNGISQIIEHLGEPISKPINIFVNGYKATKIRVLLPLQAPLKDSLSLALPNQKTKMIYLVYEKLPKVCTFCGIIGHEVTSCMDLSRIERLIHNPIANELAKKRL